MPHSSQEKEKSIVDLGNWGFQRHFEDKLILLIDDMYKKYNIVLTVSPRGGRRSFAAQAQTGSNAGPGESNHQYGLAVDFGSKLQWIDGDGVIKKDDNTYLDALGKYDTEGFLSFWLARNQFLSKRGLFPYPKKIEDDLGHIQDFKRMGSQNSLVALLNQVGQMNMVGFPQDGPHISKIKWAPGCILDSNRTYKTDFGYGSTMFDIGKARKIWHGQAWVTKDKLAKARGVSEASITLDEIAEMKRRLRGEFIKAEKARDKWKPIPVTVPSHLRGCP